MIRKSVLLDCSPERAFSLFTERAGEWWPEERRHLKDPKSEIRIEAGGRFFERARDGREADLGRVRIFEPGGRVVLDFYVGTDPQHPTEVEVTFAAEGEGARVTIEHRATDASAEIWKTRAAIFERSWDAVLAALARAASS